LVELPHSTAEQLLRATRPSARSSLRRPNTKTVQLFPWTTPNCGTASRCFP